MRTPLFCIFGLNRNISFFLFESRHGFSSTEYIYIYRYGTTESMHAFTLAIVSLYLFMMVLHINGISKQWPKYQVNALFSPTFCVPSDKSHGIYGLLLHGNQAKDGRIRTHTLFLSLPIAIKSMSVYLCWVHSTHTRLQTRTIVVCIHLLYTLCGVCVRRSEQSRASEPKAEAATTFQECKTKPLSPIIDTSCSEPFNSQWLRIGLPIAI